MKVLNEKSRVKIEGDIQTQSFGIVFDRHMVNILSNQLYEDKVLAIVRELSTNALDSQVEAGFDGVFDVHVPSWSNPTFSIRDYGTGMSPDKINNVYRNYGKSDRNESNQFTGCMGLGSKTPFCYNTKTFTVDSWHGGIHYAYACFLDEDGMPQIAALSHEPSDEPSGVKVELPVKGSDSFDFEYACQNIYRFFKTTPDMSNVDLKISRPEYTLSEDNWKYNGDLDSMRIVMGNVAYRVSTSAMGDLTSSQRAVINAGFHVFVDIGDVSVTASREGLDYSNRTKSHVRSYINNIILSFTTKAQKHIDECKNLWEARLALFKYEDVSQDFFKASDITYNGEQVMPDNKHIDFNDMCKDGKIVLNKFSYNTWRKPERKNVNAVHCGASSVPLFYTNDLRVGGFIRSIKQCQEERQTILLVTFKVDGAKEEFFERLGLDGSYFTDISTIPSPNVSSRGGYSRNKTTKVVEFIGGCGPKSNFWDNAEVDIKQDSGIYVEFNRFNAVYNGVSQHPNTLKHALGVLKSAGVTIPTIYGVKTAGLAKFAKSDQWTNFTEWATTELRHLTDGVDLVTKKLYQNELDTIGSTGYYSDSRFSNGLIFSLAKHCSSTSLLGTFASTIKHMQNMAEGVENDRSLRRACNVFNIPLKDSDVAVIDLKKLEDEVYSKYKLFKSLPSSHSSYSDNEREHLILYVNAIDKGEN